MNNDEDRRAAAIERLENKRDFGVHAVAYCVVNVFLVVIWAVAGGGTFWPIWVIAGWGIGLALHGWTTFGQRPINERAIAKEMERDVS